MVYYLRCGFTPFRKWVNPDDLRKLCQRHVYGDRSSADIIDKVGYFINQPVAGLFEFSTLHFDDRIPFPEHFTVLNIYAIVTIAGQLLMTYRFNYMT